MSTKPATPATGQTSRFKVLKAVDPSVIGGARPLEVQEVKPVHYPNAKGGLRLVDSSDVRELAKHSAQRLLKLAKV